MQTKIKVEGGTNLVMEVAEDCAVFAGTHLCHAVEKNAEVIIKQTIAAGKTKAVVVGDCEDHHSVHEERMALSMKKAGIEYIWLTARCISSGDDLPFSLTFIPRFSCAQDLGRILIVLDEVRSRQKEVEARIREETELLREYPVIGKVVSTESHEHCPFGGFSTLFGDQISRKAISKVHVVALFNIDGTKGMLMTKSETIKFKTVDGMDQGILEGRNGRSYTFNNAGSIRISVDDSAPQVSLYCEPGHWTIKEHPAIENFGINAKDRFIPMWQRIEKAPEK